MSATIETLECGKYKNRSACLREECKHEYHSDDDEKYQDPISRKPLGNNVVQTKDDVNAHCYNDDDDDHGLRDWVKTNATEPLTRRVLQPPYPTNEWQAPEPTNPFAYPPLIEAMIQYDIDTFRDLLEDELAPVSERDLREAFVKAAIEGFDVFFNVMLRDDRINPESTNCFGLASEFGQASIVRSLLEDGRADPAVEGNFPIIVAASSGYPRVVELLMADDRVDAGDDDNEAIIGAVRASGHPEVSFEYETVVRLLLTNDRVNPSARNNYCIRKATEIGQTNVVRMLLADKRVNPTANDNYAIQAAAERGFEAIVRLLLEDKRVNPTADDNYGLRKAAEQGFDTIVELLKRHGEKYNTNRFRWF